MTIYVAEVGGKAIGAMNAKNTVDANDWLGGPVFHSELLRLRGEDGNPIWDGEAEIHVRVASSEEVARRGTASRSTQKNVWIRGTTPSLRH